MTDLHITWPAPPAQWLLTASDVHVWAASLHQPSARIASFNETLSPDERQRAAQFTLDLHRHRFIAGRGMLRAILASYLNCAPRDLAFKYEIRGKPLLAQPFDAHKISFNLAHCEDLALFAVAKDVHLGIDVEKVRAMKDAEGIAARFFSARESSGLNALPEDQKPQAFFNLWTRKEAILKATGAGIAGSMNRVEVSFLPDEPAALLSLLGSPQIARTWTLHSLAPADGFCGTLASPAKVASPCCWTWL
jgi:4'-phosphopantetheinyl transferase